MEPINQFFSVELYIKCTVYSVYWVWSKASRWEVVTSTFPFNSPYFCYLCSDDVLMMHWWCVDHSDGKFLGAMKCQWFCHGGTIAVNGFSMVCFTGESSLLMVFLHLSQWFFQLSFIRNNGFSMVFFTIRPLLSMVSQWFGESPWWSLCDGAWKGIKCRKQDS